MLQRRLSINVSEVKRLMVNVKQATAMIENSHDREFALIATNLDEHYTLTDFKNDLNQIGKIHKIVIRDYTKPV